MSGRTGGVSGNPIEYLRDFGTRAGLEHLLTYALLRAFPRGFHRRAVPLLEDLDLGARSSHLDPLDLIRRYLPPPGPVAGREEAIRAIVREHADLTDELTRRVAARPGAYPEHYRIEQNTALVLYALVRWGRPATVLETGVANGASTFYLLNALARNGRGTLYSVDVSPDVGGLLETAERRAWQFRLLPPRDRQARFRAILDGLPRIDLFIHDSDHRYLWQRLELTEARRRLSERGIIACDDANASHAFPDFCRELGERPVYLVERRKVFGVVWPAGGLLLHGEGLDQASAVER